MPSRDSANDPTLKTQHEDENEDLAVADDTATTTKRPRRRRATDLAAELSAAMHADDDDATEADGASAEAVLVRKRSRKKSGPTEATPESERPSAPARDGASERLVLPVIITEETILLPHMSIPFPLVDEDSALAVERTMRMKPRHVLLLTERRIPRDRDGDDGEGPEEARDLIDLMTDMLAQGDEEGAQRLAESSVDGDLESDVGYYEDDADYELCEVGVIAEVGQYISRPGGQNHVILNGVARGRVEEIIQDQPFVAAQV